MALLKEFRLKPPRMKRVSLLAILAFSLGVANFVALKSASVKLPGVPFSLICPVIVGLLLNGKYKKPQAMGLGLGSLGLKAG
jgi:hypothetical protein